jgi:hypothetical protein
VAYPLAYTLTSLLMNPTRSGTDLPGGLINRWLPVFSSRQACRSRKTYWDKPIVLGGRTLIIRSGFLARNSLCLQNYWRYLGPLLSQISNPRWTPLRGAQLDKCEDKSFLGVPVKMDIGVFIILSLKLLFSLF